MALNQADIKNQITAAINKSSKVESDKGIDSLAESLTDIIINAIKSADIVLQPGTIQVVGGPTSQANVVPLTAKNSLS